MLILDLWGISFHAVVVFGLGKNLLFKSVLGHCGRLLGFCFFGRFGRKGSNENGAPYLLQDGGSFIFGSMSNPELRVLEYLIFCHFCNGQ